MILSRCLLRGRLCDLARATRIGLSRERLGLTFREFKIKATDAKDSRILA